MKRKVLVLLLSISLIACTNKRYPQAGQVFNPEAAKINVQLGIAYLEKGDNERAKRKLLTALNQDPNVAITQNAMAYFLEKTGDPQQAESHYKLALRIAPHSGLSHNNYGAFLCRQGRYEEAEHHFFAAVRDKDYIKSAQAYENAGLCAIKRNDYAKAKHHFEMALAQDPNSSTSALELTEITLKQKQYQQANGYLKNYLKSQKTNARTAWLGYQIAKHLGDRNQEASYALLIRSAFPKTQAYKNLLKAEKS